jgi:hypothetical protein
MTLPIDIFPEDTTDPTVDPKKFDMSVEETLGIVGHVRAATRKRPAWRKLKIEHADPRLEGGNVTPKELICRTYELPETAPIVRQDDIWAVWAGDGEPTCPAFDQEEEETVSPVQVRAQVDRNVETVAMLEAGERTIALDEASRKANAERINSALKETWAYSTKDIGDHVALRSRHRAKPGAIIEKHPNGDIEAIWLGIGSPSRPAFPELRAREPAPMPFQDVNANGNSRVKVSSVPETTLHDMGLKLYGLSQEQVFSEKTRSILLRISDELHAEASKIETARVRKNFDSLTKKS